MPFVDNLDDKEYLTGLFHAMFEELPSLKPRKKKNELFRHLSFR